VLSCVLQATKTNEDKDDDEKDKDEEDTELAVSCA
jgi:hypothetical protein